MNRRFHDRTEAGQQLAQQLAPYANRMDVIVLGLPRGGVPVAYEVAKALHAPLDICLVRKLGVPQQKELAMGAIAADGILILNHEILQLMHISRQALQQVVEVEKQELERRDRLYRGNRPLPDVRDRVVILVDDGIATSSTLRAAIAFLRQHQPRSIVVATPVAPPSTCQALQSLVDDVVCLMTPEPLYSIGSWYVDFSQTSDQEVQRLLQPFLVPETATVAPPRGESS